MPTPATSRRFERSPVAAWAPALVAALALVATVALPAPAEARAPRKPKTIDSRDLRPGMKGYGLTVMRGQKIERFQIEVIGVLYNKLPGQDMILVRCAGLNLEHTGVIAGMSGSPVFVKGPKGKDLLVGAVSYAFPFNKDPVAGVTPIASMWPELNRPLRPLPPPQRLNPPVDGKRRRKVRRRAGVWMQAPPESDATAASLAGLSSSYDPSGAQPSASGEASFDPGRMKPIALPLSAAGFHPELVSEMQGAFKSMGFGPVHAAAVGAAASGGAFSSKSEPFQPGSAISLSLVRGDMNIAGVGTVTWVHGDRFIAFGHPFRGVGQLHLPVGNAHIVWVTASQVNSFKMGVPLSDIGVLDQDRLAAVSGRIGPRAAMIPMDVRVHSKAAAVDKTWKVEIVDQPKFFPLAVSLVLGNALKTSEPVAQDAWVKMKLTFELEGDYPPLVFRDQLVSVSGSGGFFALRGLAMRIARALVTNGFKRIRTKAVHAEFEVGQGRPLVFMESIRMQSEKVRVGDRPVLNVGFIRPNTQPTTVKLVLPKIPKELAGEKLKVWVGSASRKPIERPPPKDVNDVLQSMREYQPRNRLVAVISLPGRSWMIRGQRLESLPNSVMDELKGHRRAMRSGHRTLRVSKELPWAITGSGNVVLQVEDDN